MNKIKSFFTNSAFLYFIAIILAIAFAISTFFIYQALFSNTKESSLGVITPVLSEQSEKIELTNSNLQIIIDDEVPIELQTAMIELTESIESIDFNSNIYVLDSESSTDFVNEANSGSIFKIGNLYLSGNNIIITDSSYPMFRHPRDLFTNLLIADQLGKWYVNLSSEKMTEIITEDRNYQLTDLVEFSEYLNTADIKLPVASETSDSQFLVPYPETATKYSEKSNFCMDEFKSEIVLFICESALFINQENAELIPPDVRKFMQNSYELTAPGYYKHIGSSTNADLNQIASELDLSKSRIDYDNWEIEPFSRGTLYIAGKSNFYHRVTKSTFNKVDSELKSEGWKKSSETDPIADSIFAADKFVVTYERQNKLTNQELVILILDTDTLNSDCITVPDEASQQQFARNSFCSDQSIFKDTGYYVQFAVAESGLY